MPDTKGVLTQEERDKVVRWLGEQQAAGANCPMCANPNWIVAPNLVLLPLYFPGGAFAIGAGFPVVLIFCSRCAYTRMHNAMAIGLVEPPKEEKKQEAQPEEAKHGA